MKPIIQCRHPKDLVQANAYIQELLGYQVKNIDFLEQALWAYPAITSAGTRLEDGNKDIAVVGDAVIHIVAWWFTIVSLKG